MSRKAGEIFRTTIAASEGESVNKGDQPTCELLPVLVRQTIFAAATAEFAPCNLSTAEFLYLSPMSEIQITEKFLINTGGWQALKHAKALVEMGRVVSFNYTPPVLRGLVREGEIEYRAGLKIRSYTDVENLCSCRDSREWGSICAHSMALGLALIQPKPTLAKPAPDAGPIASSRPGCRE